MTDQDKQRIDAIAQAAGVRLVALGNAQKKWDADPRPIKHPTHAHLAKGKRPTDQHCTGVIDPNDVVWLCGLAAPHADQKQAKIVQDLLLASTSVLAAAKPVTEVHLIAAQIAMLCDLASKSTAPVTTSEILSAE